MYVIKAIGWFIASIASGIFAYVMGIHGFLNRSFDWRTGSFRLVRTTYPVAGIIGLIGVIMFLLAGFAEFSKKEEALRKEDILEKYRKDK